jgi:hypothetical protein
MSDNAENKTILRNLKCKLTQVEIDERRESVLKKLDEKDRIDFERKRVADGFKSKIGVIDEEISDLRSTLKRGYEDRNVECDEERDYALGKVFIRRLDTFEIVEERAMTVDERQPKLPLPKPTANDKAKQVDSQLQEIVSKAGAAPKKEEAPKSTAPDPAPAKPESAEGEDDRESEATKKRKAKRSRAGVPGAAQGDSQGEEAPKTQAQESTAADSAEDNAEGAGEDAEIPDDEDEAERERDREEFGESWLNERDRSRPSKGKAAGKG